MNKTSPTIVDLSIRVGELARKMSASAGLPPHSPMLFGLASGFDIAITLFEESTGMFFDGLTPESAERIVNYFLDESGKSGGKDVQA